MSLSSIKEAIYHKWCTKLEKFEKEREDIQETIKKNLQFYSFEAIKKVGPIEKFLVNVDGRCYEVNFLDKNIHLHVDDDTKQRFAIEVRYDDIAPYHFIHFNYCNYRTEAFWYKNYTRNYEDIKIIIDFIGNYLANKKVQQWNTIQKIDEAFDFVTRGYGSYSRDFLFIGNSIKSCLLIDVNNNCSFNYERFAFNKISLNDFFDVIKFYKDILISNRYDKDIIEKDIEKYYSFYWYKNINKIASFLKYFKINKQLFSIINGNWSIQEEYEKISKSHIDIQEEKIKNLFKKINPKLLNLVNAREQQENHNYEKFKNSLKLDFSKMDTTKLFYNPKRFNFLLPEDFTIYGNRISVYVTNFIDFSDKTTENIKKNVLEHIEIMFSLYSHNDRFFFVTTLENLLKEIDGANIFSAYSHSLSHEIMKNRIKENLVKLIKNKKFQLLQYIFSKMDEHIDTDIDKDTNVNNNCITLSDTFLINHAENYFDNCIKM